MCVCECECECVRGPCEGLVPVVGNWVALGGVARLVS